MGVVVLNEEDRVIVALGYTGVRGVTCSHDAVMIEVGMTSSVMEGVGRIKGST